MTSIVNLVDALERNDPNRTRADEFVYLERLMRAMCDPDALAAFQNTQAGDHIVLLIGKKLRLLPCADAPDLDSFLDALFQFTPHYKFPKHLDAIAVAPSPEYDDPQ